MGQGGGDPKWVGLRIGPMRAPLRMPENQSHHKHWDYVTILGIAAGMLALVCFYLCVWLVRHGQIHSRQRGPRAHGTVGLGDVGGSHIDLEPEKGRRKEGEGEKATWNGDGEVELVLMAGEDVPTFLAHRVLPSTPIKVDSP